MGSFSIWHGLFFLMIAGASIAITVVPLWRIVSRMGFNGAWSLLSLIPGVSLVMLWVVAFSKWPIEDQPRP